MLNIGHFDKQEKQAQLYSQFLQTLLFILKQSYYYVERNNFTEQRETCMSAIMRVP